MPASKQENEFLVALVDCSCIKGGERGQGQLWWPVLGSGVNT